MERYAHSVIDVARTLAESHRGASDPMGDVALVDAVKWLRWRISPAQWDGSDNSDYGNAVRAMAFAALEFGCTEIERRARRTTPTDGGRGDV